MPSCNNSEEFNVFNFSFFQASRLWYSEQNDFKIKPYQSTACLPQTQKAKMEGGAMQSTGSATPDVVQLEKGLDR